jgi:hypothetical protein
MPKLVHSQFFSLGSERFEQEDEPSKNHFSSGKISSEIQGQIDSMGLSRIAGNVFICPSNKQFWSLRNGKLVRLTSQEVDNGEAIPSAPRNEPVNFLAKILGEIEF